MKKVKMVPIIMFNGDEYRSSVSLFRLKEALKAAISVLQTIETIKDLDLEDNPVLRLTCLEYSGEYLSFGLNEADELREILTELETLPNEE